MVLASFWTFTCINWLRQLPYLRAWAEKYSADGLVVVGVHTPEFTFEHDPGNVRRAVQDLGISYPVAIDSDYAIWRAFDNHYWPALYLAGSDGRIRRHQFGEGEYDRSEKVIRQLLAEADVVLTDRLAPRSLLDELGEDVLIIDASKIPYGRAMAQEHINAALVEHAQAGRFVARLKGGDPFVFGRGAEEVLACLRAGVPVTVVPGVTSAVAVPASAWVPVTHRGVAQEFHVVSVHVPPGDERSTVNWELLGGSSGTLVLLMAVERIGAVTAELLRYGRNPDTPVSVIADGTLPTQRTISSTLEQVEGLVAKEGIRPPAIVVVGDVVSVATEITELMRDVTA